MAAFMAAPPAGGAGLAPALLPRRSAAAPGALARHAHVTSLPPQQQQQQQQQHRARATVAAVAAAVSAAALSVPPALAEAEAVVRQHGGWFAPPLTQQPEVLLRQQVPFLTQQAGALPETPRNLHHALYTYGSYASKYVSVRVQNVHVKLSSWDHAVQVLADAEERRQPYWCSLIEQVQHPAWWPTTGHVPTYDQVIFGRGNASIGLHFDKDNACAGGSRTPVSTYLAATEGAKLVLLLPPDQTLLPHGGDPDLLLRPTPQLLDDVRAAGGYFFVLEDVGKLQHGGGGAAAAAAGSSDGGFSATALYLPAGWYHWLVGLTDWHVVYGGSFYPEQQEWLRAQH